PYNIVGGVTPYTVSASGLPPGLSAVLAGSGTAMNIVGTPVMPVSGAGNPSTAYPVTLTVTDANGKTGTLAISITVTDPRAPFNVALPSGTTWAVGAALATFTPVAQVGVAPAGFAVTWSATNLPAGVTINAATGVLTAPAAPGGPANTTTPISIVFTATETAPACAGSAAHTATSAAVSLTVTGHP
ncbi:MAG TPA: hypothetical protein VF580_15150, partial [Thermoanaerobaculia bacterium]